MEITDTVIYNILTRLSIYSNPEWWVVINLPGCQTGSCTSGEGTFEENYEHYVFNNVW